MLAQIQDVSHLQLGTATAIFITVALVGSNVALAVAAFKKRNISPQPLAIKLEEKFVDCESFRALAAQVERNQDPPNSQLKQSHEDLVERVEKLEAWKDVCMAKLESDKLDILDSDETRASKIHARLDDLVKAVSMQSGEIKGLRGTVESIVSALRKR